MHTPGETFDHTSIWMPKEKILFPGDLFYASYPMLASPMKPDHFLLFEYYLRRAVREIG